MPDKPGHIFCTNSSSRISRTVSSLMILPVRLWNAAHSCSASLASAEADEKAALPAAFVPVRRL
jgi:hypothetical protein